MLVLERLKLLRREALYIIIIKRNSQFLTRCIQLTVCNMTNTQPSGNTLAGSY